MTTYFVDTSALAKRYSIEVGTPWLRRRIIPSANNDILVSQLALIEVCSLLARREHAGEFTAAVGQRLRNTFLAHMRDQYAVIGIDDLLVAQAKDLVITHVALRLRSLDSIQLACALKARAALQQPMTFLAADYALLAAAAAEGFITDNPSLHS